MAGNRAGCFLWRCSTASVVWALAESHLQPQDPLGNACVVGFPFTYNSNFFMVEILLFFCLIECLNLPNFLKPCIKLWWFQHLVVLILYGSVYCAFWYFWMYKLIAVPCPLTGFSPHFGGISRAVFPVVWKECFVEGCFQKEIWEIILSFSFCHLSYLF